MKKIFLLGLTYAFYSCAFGQWLTQSAEGKGTFLFKGMSASFDIGKTSASFSLNNLFDPGRLLSKRDNFGLICGGSLSAKNEENIANLFSRGDFVPEGNMFGFIGIKLTNLYSRQRDLYDRRIDTLRNNLMNAQEKRFRDQIKGHVRRIVKSEIKDTSVRRIIIAAWSNQEAIDNGIMTYTIFIMNDTTLRPNPQIAAAKNTLLKQIERISDSNARELEVYNAYDRISYEDFQKRVLAKFSLFLFSTGEASTFKRVEAIDTTKPSKSFVKEEYRGGSFGVGINYQIGRLKIGATYSRKLTNNFALLDKEDYKLTTTTKGSGQTLVQEKSITAYTGKYGRAFINEFNVDLMYSFRLDRESNNYCMVNPYMRGTYNSNDQTVLPNNYSLGMAMYFYGDSSKLLGGFYVELYDVGNNIERQKPEVEQHIKKPYNRLTFGVLAKLNLNSIIAYQ